MPFESPNHTQTPNDLFDRFMRDMAEPELKVVLAVLRATLGFHRDEIRLSIKEMMKLTGLSENGVLSGARAAEARKLIQRVLDGKKKTTWRANILTSRREVRSTSPGEVSLPHGVRLSTSRREEQGGSHHHIKDLKERGKEREHPPAANAANPTSLITELEKAFDINLDGDAPMVVHTLARHGAQPGQVKAFVSWWQHKDWRGQKGEPPTAKQIAQLWPQAFKSHKKITKLVGVRDD